MTFQEFMSRVNKEINHLTGNMGLTSSDIGDYLYYDAFEDGCNPEDVALEALENDDLYLLMFSQYSLSRGIVSPGTTHKE